MSDTKRKVEQLNSDVNAIYHLLEGIDDRLNKQGGMIRRQGSRLDQIQGNIADVEAVLGLLRSNVAEVKGDLAEFKVLLQAILNLLADPENNES